MAVEWDKLATRSSACWFAADTPPGLMDSFDSFE